MVCCSLHALVEGSPAFFLGCFTWAVVCGGSNSRWSVGHLPCHLMLSGEPKEKQKWFTPALLSQGSAPHLVPANSPQALGFILYAAERSTGFKLLMA